MPPSSVKTRLPSPVRSGDDLLERMVRAAAASAGVVGVQSGVNAKRQHRHFGDTEGSRQHQHLVECGAMLVANASGDGRHPATQLSELLPRQHRWRRMGVRGRPGHGANADRVGERGRRSCSPRRPLPPVSPTSSSARNSSRCRSTSPPATPLNWTGSSATSANFAGTSFIRREDIGSLRYGSPAVTITSDPTVPGTRGSFAFDDEGTPASSNGLWWTGGSSRPR